jgi:hypothetical protein
MEVCMDCESPIFRQDEINSVEKRKSVQKVKLEYEGAVANLSSQLIGSEAFLNGGTRVDASRANGPSHPLAELRSDDFLVVAWRKERAIPDQKLTPCPHPREVCKAQFSPKDLPLPPPFFALFCIFSPSTLPPPQQHQYHQHRRVDSCFIIPLNLVVRHSLSTISHSLRKIYAKYRRSPIYCIQSQQHQSRAFPRNFTILASSERR